MVPVLDFIIATLGIVFGRKDCRTQKGPFGDNVFNSRILKRNVAANHLKKFVPSLIYHLL